jgi:hypothetical protein
MQSTVLQYLQDFSCNITGHALNFQPLPDWSGYLKFRTWFMKNGSINNNNNNNTRRRKKRKERVMKYTTFGEKYNRHYATCLKQAVNFFVA